MIVADIMGNEKVIVVIEHGRVLPAATIREFLVQNIFVKDVAVYRYDDALVGQLEEYDIPRVEESREVLLEKQAVCREILSAINDRLEECDGDE